MAQSGGDPPARIPTRRRGGFDCAVGRVSARRRRGRGGGGVRGRTPLPTLFFFAPPAGEPANLADHLLVVYKTKDPDSAAPAAYYAAKRNIPMERILGIACRTTEEITRQQYEQT